MTSIGSARALEAIEWLNLLSGALLLFLVVWGPWALGCDSDLGRRWLVTAGLSLGVLLSGKWLIRYRFRLRGSPFSPAGLDLPKSVVRLTQLLAFLSVAILFYGAIALGNGRSPNPGSPVIAWLPSALSTQSARDALTLALSLAATFWAARDWLLGGDFSDNRTASRRQQFLFWCVALNGFVLALVSMAQRIDGSLLLLWTYPSPLPTVDYSWGPFYYRASGAQYFNLIWPVILGFLWLRWRRQRVPFLVLATVAPVAMICPTLTGSRGGMLLSFVSAAVMVMVLWRSTASRNPRLLGGLLAAGLVVTGGGLALGWKYVSARFQKSTFSANFTSLTGRVQQNRHSWALFTGRPWLGAGPGCYEAAYRQAGLPNPWHPAGGRRADSAGFDFWHYKAHNDWLQMAVEWGLAGSIPIVAALCIALLFPWLTGSGHPVISWGLWTGIATLLAQATFDYPAQIPGILSTFILLLAALVGQLPRRGDFLEEFHPPIRP